MSDAKLKEGIFDGPLIRKLLKEDVFVTEVTSTEKRTWLSFKTVEQFLGNVECPEWKKKVSRIAGSFKKLTCSMSLKLRFMDFHVEYCANNLRDYSKEQAVRFHQDMKVMEQRYQGR